MLIKHPEDIDQFFKKRLDHLPIQFHEADWNSLNKLLDQNIPTSKLKPTKIITSKLIFIIFLILSIIAGLIFGMTVHKTEKKEIPYEQKKKESLIIEKDTVKPSVSSSVPVLDVESEKRKNSTLTKKISSKSKSADSSSLPSKEVIHEEPKNNDIFW